AETKTETSVALVRDGDRAASLAGNEDAQRYVERAAELADAPGRRAELLARAGQMAWAGARREQARIHFEAAMTLFGSAGQSRPAARVSSRMAEVDWKGGRLDEAIERMEQAFAIMSDDKPDEDLARLAAQLGRLHYF